MSDKDKPTDDEQERTSNPEIAPNENHDGTAPQSEGTERKSAQRAETFFASLQRDADPNTLYESATTLARDLQEDAKEESRMAENNKATARTRLATHLKVLLFIFGGGMVMFGASSELLDLSGIDLGLNFLPAWALAILVAAIPASTTFFAWHELNVLRASYIRHQQEKAAYLVYQQEISAMKKDYLMIMDGMYHEQHRPSKEATVGANPSTMRLFRYYHTALLVTCAAVTVCLVALAIMA